MNNWFYCGFEPCFAKSIVPCQPVQPTKADIGRNCLLSLNFLHVKGPFNIRNHVIVSIFKQLLAWCDTSLTCTQPSFVRAWFIYKVKQA